MSKTATNQTQAHEWAGPHFADRIKAVRSRQDGARKANDELVGHLLAEVWRARSGWATTCEQRDALAHQAVEMQARIEDLEIKLERATSVSDA